MRKLQVSFITLRDEEYPDLLKRFIKPPVILYKKRTYSFNKEVILASFVRTRKVAKYRSIVIELLVKDLVAAGGTIYLRRNGSLCNYCRYSNSGKWENYCGSGSSDDFYTSAENIGLYKRILECGGAIVSENRPGLLPNIGSYPIRNRIIALLSRGILMTEGAFDSGSLITANNIFDTDRKVFAVPGLITSSVSTSPISLIVRGARMIVTTNDILEGLQITRIRGTASTKSFKEVSREEKRIIIVLQDQNLHFDELVKATGFSSSHIGILFAYGGKKVT
jgi:DNA processing protein